MSLTISPQGVDLVKHFEGLHTLHDDNTVTAYRCPAGRWTIGYGTTKGVRSGDRITVEEAEERLIEDLQTAAAAVRSKVSVPLSQNQFDALVSFVHNLGAGNFASSTLLKKLNRGQYDEVPEQFLRWNKARVDGVLTELRGLTRRRTAEAALFTMDAPLASQGGDKMPQKPEQAAKKPLTKSRTMAGVSVAGLAAVLSEVSAQLEGLIPHSEAINILFLIISLAGIALAAYARIDDHNRGDR